MKASSQSTLHEVVRYIPQRAARRPVLLLALLVCLAALMAGVYAQTAAAATITFTEQELLGRPTDTTMTIKVVPDAAISLYYEFGTTSGVYTRQTATTAATAAQPSTVTITGLSANTHYYYRMRYTTDGGTTWTTRAEHSFWTKRAAGSTFTFDITTDSHVNIQLGNGSNWTSTLNGVASDNPDFLVDLGDTVAMDNGSTSVALGDTAAAEQKYKDTLPYFNTVSGSAPIFLVAGNHEQQEAWHLQGTLANSLPIMGKNAEKKFYLNPVPNSFYSGDARTMSDLSGDHLVQDYYAWTWGDALFVTISPFWTTTTKPYTTSAGGGETDATGSGNRWDWTLGADQFNWLKSTLANSNAKYKFVFSHEIIGGNGMTTPVNQVNYSHGGMDSANFVEWGGYNIDGTTYTWGTNRNTAVWGSLPIREMMEANGVTAFFHGHDHQMAYETANGMVCQSVPSGSFSGSFGNYTTGTNFTVRNATGGTSTGQTVWADSTQGAGHLRVTVGPDQTKVEFVRYNQTSTAAYNYTMAPKVTAPSTINVTAPTGTTSKAQGASLPVTWTTDTAVASGEFSVWAVSPANSWYVGKIHAADGSASYSDSIDLNVPVDTGYRVFVYYRATSGDPWGIYGYASGTVNVTAAAFNAISVTAPTGTQSKAQGASLPVTWTTNQAVASGQFSVWVVSSGNSWYVGKIHAADGTASYSDSVDLNVPVDTGYRVFVYYRATSGDPWGLYGFASGTVNVTAAAFNAISVTAPTGTQSKAQGASLPVTWTTNQAVASGQFSVWVVSSGNSWYVGKIHAADGTASYSDSVDLNVPVDTGYRVFVYYRATSGDPWGLYGFASGTVNVTAAAFNAISVTAPTGTQSKAQGASLPVTWTTNQAVASGQFSVWVVSSGNSWYVGKIHAADGTASYADSVTLSVPVDTGYRIFVYYRATSGDPWGIYGFASGTVNVTAR